MKETMTSYAHILIFQLWNILKGGVSALFFSCLK